MSDDLIGVHGKRLQVKLSMQWCSWAHSSCGQSIRADMDRHALQAGA